MFIDSIDSLLTALRRLELLAPEQVDEVEAELGPHFGDAEGLARFLVEAQWLTAFQFEALFEGRWDELALGPYLLLDRLGEGGVSEVFKAWDNQRGRVVAVKVMRQGLPGQLDAVRQFERELEAVERLNHPNIIKTFDAHQVGATRYFAMECVEGTDLQRHIRAAGPLPVELACDCVRQVAQGLQHAHQVGLIHRDIKPANLFLIAPPGGASAGARPGPPAPQIKVLDWGLARLMPAPGQVIEMSGVEHDAEKGRLIGTADYIAPEQAQDAYLADTRADIYSLGCTFFYLLTGRPPFAGGSLLHKMLQHQEAEPPSVRAARPEVPEEVDTILRRMLAKRPEDRFQIPLLAAAALRHFCPGAVPAGGSVIRPPSSATLRALQAGGDPRPSTVTNLSRPSTITNLRRPNHPPRR
jgi:serine/threonine-protein kinase